MRALDFALQTQEAQMLFYWSKNIIRMSGDGYDYIHVEMYASIEFKFKDALFSVLLETGKLFYDRDKWYPKNDFSVRSLRTIEGINALDLFKYNQDLHDKVITIAAMVSIGHFGYSNEPHKYIEVENNLVPIHRRIMTDAKEANEVLNELKKRSKDQNQI